MILGASFPIFELRTPLTRKQKDIPSGSNRPSIHFYIGYGKIAFHDQFSIKLEPPTISFFKKWTNICVSIDFKGNELQISMNGELFEKVKTPKTGPFFQNQLGGMAILEETSESKFFFAFGRYYFDDQRYIMKYAGVNAWNRTLREEELVAYSSCSEIPEKFEEGNLMNRNTKWIYPTSPFISEMTYKIDDILCNSRNTAKVVPMPILRDTKPAMVDVCKKFGTEVRLGGDIRSLEDIKHYYKMIHSNERFGRACGYYDGGRFRIWLPYTINNQAEIIHDITGEKFDLGEDYFLGDGPVRALELGKILYTGYFGNMVSMKARLNPWVTSGLLNANCAMCVIPSSLKKTTIIKLRGLCKFSVFDEEYQVVVSSEGYINYYGFARTVISYNYTLMAWQISDIINPGVFATFESSFRTLGLGTNIWRVVNDEMCQKGVVSKPFSLTACQETQFTCGDGLCIELEERCNGVPDCKDKTDEVSCTVSTMDSSYNKFLSPPPQNKSSKVEVMIGITIQSLDSFEIIESRFKVEFEVNLRWYDSRLSFNNLREDKGTNSMGPDEKISIWFPSFVFFNTQQKLESIVDGKSLISVERNGEGTLADSTFTEAKLVYKCKENPIVYERLYNEYFTCDYQMPWYPFDTQKCKILIKPTQILKKYVSFIPGKFRYIGPKDLREYMIIDNGMEILEVNGERLVIVQTTLGRRLLSIILTIFVPTLILNVIGHMANYFKEFFFEAVISLNVTVMLVLTTMFINVSNNLPKTAYIKMIDVWLLFNLFKPFIDIIVQTYIESLRGEGEQRDINHHGKTITVGEETKRQPELIKVEPIQTSEVKLARM